MPNNPEEEPSKFRIEGDPDLRLTESEIEAQQAAQDKIRNRLHRDGVLVELDEEEAEEKAHVNEASYGESRHAAEDVRAGQNKDIRMPSEESYAAMLENDPDTAHLVKLGQLKPGSAEFQAKYYPPPEPTIEVIGPKGAEGVGIIKRYDVTGTKEL